MSQQNEELRRIPSSRILLSQNENTIDMVSELRLQVQTLQTKLMIKKEKIAALKQEMVQEKLRYKENLQRQEQFLTQHTTHYRPPDDLLTVA